MKLKFWLILALCLPLVGFARVQQPAYWGLKSSEALLEYEHFVVISQEEARNQKTVEQRIERQITFLFGALSNRTEQGTPHQDGKFQILSAENKESQVWFRYRYQGKFVFENSVKDTISFYLPRNPQTIYRDSITKSAGGYIFYSCTDQSHYEEQYFWYFWNPTQFGCPLVLGKHYDQVVGQVTRLENTISTYPKYQELLNKSSLEISLIVGMDNPSESHNPMLSKDLSAGIYRKLRQNLIQMGYQSRVWDPRDVLELIPNYIDRDIYVESFSKKTLRGLVEIKVFFGQSASYGGGAFHYFFKQALEKSAVVIYAGHSGLGEYLNPDLIEQEQNFEIKLDENKEQIFFFNGCSTYPYYNASYFARKGSGSLHLDIMTNGLSTLFSAIEKSTMSLVRALDTYMVSGEKTSYQDIVSRADSHNLIGINGDEDNQ